MERSVSRHQFWVAVTITLILHAAVLFALSLQPLRSEPAASDQFVAVDFIDDAVFGQVQEQTLEELMQSRLNERVANLAANEAAQRSDDRRSTTMQNDITGLSESVENELRAMEQAEFERLAQEKKEFDLRGVPDDGASGEVSTLKEWDKRYEGQVTVSYDLGGRLHRKLPVPGYKCQVAGAVSIAITVAPNGGVSSAEIESVTALNAKGKPLRVSESNDCIARAALESARASIFEATADNETSGLLNYRFLAQE